MKSQKQIEIEFIERINFDQYMELMEFIVNFIESKTK